MHWREAEKMQEQIIKITNQKKIHRLFFQYSRSCLTRLLFRCSVSLSPLQSCVQTYGRTDGRTDIHVYHTYATVFLEKWQQSEVKFHERGTCILIKICCLAATSVATQLIIQKKTECLLVNVGIRKQNALFFL